MHHCELDSTADDICDWPVFITTYACPTCIHVQYIIQFLKN